MKVDGLQKPNDDGWNSRAEIIEDAVKIGY